MTTCPVWARERYELSLTIGDNICVASLLSAMMDSAEGMEVVAKFCNRIMLRKEQEERDRERRAREEALRRRFADAPRAAIARRGGGTWRIRHDLLRRGLFGRPRDGAPL